MAADDGKTSSDLLEFLAKNGRNVTPTTLARWHREGLIPPPIQKALGRGRGSITVYPANTEQQLLALTKIRKHFRDLDEVGFRLWLDGFPVAPRFSRGYLKSAAEQCDQHIRNLKIFRDRLESDDEAVSDRTFVELQRINTAKLSTRFPRRLRKRVGSKNFDGAVRVIVDIATGKFFDFQDKDVEQFTRTMLGIKKVDNQMLGGALGWLNDSVAPTLRDLSLMLGDQSFCEILQRYSDDDLDKARQEFIELFFGLAHFSNIISGRHGKKIPGFSAISEILTFARAIDLAWIFIAWCQMRRMPWARNYPGILAALRLFRVARANQTVSTG